MSDDKKKWKHPGKEIKAAWRSAKKPDSLKTFARRIAKGGSGDKLVASAWLQRKGIK